jgi:uncharacterized protein YchJ
MKFMADRIHEGHAAAEVMAYVRGEDRLRMKKSPDSPNAPCACGSGRKSKKCCGALAGV